MLTYEEITGKLITLEGVQKIFTPAYRSDHTIVFTNGCFDLLHRGHVYYLSRARELGSLLVVGLNSDASTSILKGPERPINDQQARAEVLGALGFVDYVVIFEEETPLELIKVVRPDILIKGGDYKAEEIVGYNEMISWGGKVETIPVLEGYSSSSMIQRTR